MTEYRRTTKKTVTQRRSPFGPAVVTEDEDETFIEGTSEEIVEILTEAEFEQDPQPVTNTFYMGTPGTSEVAS